MKKVILAQCGGESKEYQMIVETDDFSIEIDDRQFRFEILPSGDIRILLINGIDVRVISERGYAGIELIKKGGR
ncbi:hypothetical protein EBB07_29170 [Paenibacillaceae bacterium]|nr:hypothetical protein EBB07_29170 [Paenibacillaceae bacterium]